MADRRLKHLAYRLLGSVEDAEDVVQDAHLKLLGLADPPGNRDAFLFRVVTNLAIDRLRHRKVERRAYPGPWLPEPLATESMDAEAAAARQDDLSLGFVLLLETLSVSERVAFVLREAFDLGFHEIAEILEVRADACRQRYHRARRKVAGAGPPPQSPRAQRRALERLSQAVADGDPRAVAEMLTDDALLITDGGGRVAAAVRPVEAPERIARVLIHLASREDHADLRWQLAPLNGGIGLLLVRDGGGACELYASVHLDVTNEQVSRIYVVRNPTKLGSLSLSLSAIRSPLSAGGFSPDSGDGAE